MSTAAQYIIITNSWNIFAISIVMYLMLSIDMFIIEIPKNRTYKVTLWQYKATQLMHTEY